MGWSLLGEKDTNIVGHIRTSLGHFPPRAHPPGHSPARTISLPTLDIALGVKAKI